MLARSDAPGVGAALLLVLVAGCSSATRFAVEDPPEGVPQSASDTAATARPGYLSFAEWRSTLERAYGAARYSAECKEVWIACFLREPHQLIITYRHPSGDERFHCMATTRIDAAPCATQSFIPEVEAKMLQETFGLQGQDVIGETLADAVHGPVDVEVEFQYRDVALVPGLRDRTGWTKSVTFTVAIP